MEHPTIDLIEKFRSVVGIPRYAHTHVLGIVQSHGSSLTAIKLIPK
jgi:hypothetical protein